MRCLIISGARMRPEARDLVLKSLHDEITDWIEIPPEIGVIAKYLRQADFVFVGGTSSVSKEVITYLVEHAHLPVIIVTNTEELLREGVKGHPNVVLVPSLTVESTERDMLSTRIRTAYFGTAREALPYAFVTEGDYYPLLVLPNLHLSPQIRVWFRMGWRVGRLIVWHGHVLEILQDTVIPCGDRGDYSHRVLFCRQRPGLHQDTKYQDLIEVFAEKWEL